MGKAAGAVGGGLGGLVGAGLGAVLAHNAQGTEGATDTGNAFIGSAPGQAASDYRNRMLQAEEEASRFTPEFAAQQVQGNDLYKGLFGQGGIMEQTQQQEQQQANQPWQLTDQDRTAYGQASSDIARQFGESEQSLSQSLANRGLSSSGVAGAAFTGQQGNKNEQLAQLQTQIANNRMQQNMARLGQTQQFLSALGGQAQNAVGQELGARQWSNTQNFNRNAGMLGNFQNQSNTQLEQRMATEHPTDASQQLNAATSMGMSAMGPAAKFAGGMGG